MFKILFQQKQLLKRIGLLLKLPLHGALSIHHGMKLRLKAIKHFVPALMRMTVKNMHRIERI
jgi:hypothetical protein